MKQVLRNGAGAWKRSSAKARPAARARICAARPRARRLATTYQDNTKLSSKNDTTEVAMLISHNNMQKMCDESIIGLLIMFNLRALIFK